MNWILDADIAAYFDRVNHDILMGRVAKKVSDKPVLGLIRRYLQAGVLEHGLVEATHEGTPQGGSAFADAVQYFARRTWTSELERRGHRFARYADDSNIYVISRRAGERVKASVTRS